METRFRSNRPGASENSVAPKILINDRPHNFARNGLRRGASNTEPEYTEFRRALPQFLAVGVKNILLFVYGMTLGFPTIVIPAIQGGEGREPSDIVLSRDEISWFSSINLICVPLGCIFSGAFTSPIGKRRAMQIVNFPILTSWLLFHFSTNIGYLYAGLCLSGLSGGLMEAPVLTYVAEITEPKYRGMLAASGSACVIMGVFIQFILGSILDWRTIAAVSTVFPVISIVALFFVPESPHWLIRMNRFPEAVKALCWLRGWVPEYKVETEFNELYDSIIVKPSQEAAAEGGGGKKSVAVKYIRLFKKRSFLAPFSLILLTFFIGHFSGKTTLQTYAVQIFHTLKTPVDKYHATILLGLAELIGTILCIVLIHFTGKRPLVFTSTIGCGFCIFGTAAYAYFLKAVPGFAVANVVSNASSLVPQENIITINNVTEIFDKEEEALEKLGLLKVISLPSLEQPIFTTIIPALLETTTFIYLDDIDEDDNKTDLYNRTIRSLELDNSFNLTDDYFDFLSGNSDDNLQIDLNQTDYPSYDLFNETVQDNTEPSSRIDVEEMLNPSENNHEIHEKILVAVPKQKKNKYLWIPLVLLLGSAFFAHLGIRLIPWMLIGEVFPAAIRSNASGISGGMGYIFGFLANKLFLQMLSTMTLPGTFWFYSAVSFVGTVILYFVLPETEGRSLSDIENEFSGSKPKRPKESTGSNEDNTVQAYARPNLQKVADNEESTWRIPSNSLNFDTNRLSNNIDLSRSRTRKDSGCDNKGFSMKSEGKQNTTKL